MAENHKAGRRPPGDDFDTGYYYRIHVGPRDLDHSLEIDPETRGVRIATNADEDRQLWRMTYVDRGVYRLHSKALSLEHALDVINDSRDDRVHMAPVGNYSGQLWTMIPNRGSIAYRLQNAFTGRGVYLDHRDGQPWAKLARGRAHTRRHWIFRKAEEIEAGQRDAFASEAAGHQRAMTYVPYPNDPLRQYYDAPVSERIAPFPDGAWYLWLYDLPGQDSRMTYNLSHEPFYRLAGKRRIHVELLNVRREDRSKVRFKLTADKKNRRDRTRSTSSETEPHPRSGTSALPPIRVRYFSHGTTSINVHPGTDGDRGFYVSGIRGMTMKAFSDRNPNAVIRIEPVPPLDDLDESARSKLGLLPGEFPDYPGGEAPNGFPVRLERQPIYEGNVPFVGSIPPNPSGTPPVVTTLQNTLFHTVHFPKAGQSTEACGDPDATVVLPPGESLTPEQMTEIYGTPKPSLSQEVPVVICVQRTNAIAQWYALYWR